MASIQGIYVAIFGRPADPAGLAYWKAETNNGADLSKMLAALSGTDEFKVLYDGKTNTEIVTAVYQSLFGRAPDDAGLEIFVNGLEDGSLNFGSIAVNILDGAKDSDKAIVDNKVAAADTFTESLDTQAEIDAYVGTAAANAAREFLTPITSDASTIPTKEQIDTKILDVVALPPEGGQAPVGGGGGGGGGGGTPAPTLEQRADAIFVEWQEQDTNYVGTVVGTPERALVDAAFIRLGVEYVEYLNDGGVVLTDIRVKDSDPGARDQSLHDNLLGNIKQTSIEGRKFDDGLETELITLVANGGEKFLDRPYEDGKLPKPALSDADKWDALNGVDRPDLVKTLVNLDDGTGTSFGDVTWQKDRALLDSIEWIASVGNGGSDAIAFNIDKDGVTEGGNRYQGASIKVDGSDLDVAHGAKVSFDFFIDPEWAGDSEAQLSGVWVQMEAPGYGSAEKAYSIVEYLDEVASSIRSINENVENGQKPTDDFVGFRFWSSDDGYEKYVEFDEQGWVNMSFEFVDGANIWSVNGQELYRDEGTAAQAASLIETLIFNSTNFGEDETYLYDNVELTGVSVIEDFYIV
jgi:hypothetical protein